MLEESTLQTGDLIYIKSDTYPLLNHVGIYLRIDGKGHICDNSPANRNHLGGSIDMSDFNYWIKNREFVKSVRTGIDRDTIRSAYNKYYTFKYDPVNFNCEHFVNEVVKKESYSKQLNNWLNVLMSAVTILAIRVNNSVP